MLDPTPLTRQLAAQQDDRLRVLIVGAGVAGVTLARLLRRQGLHPVLIERARPDRSLGYMLGMLPFIDPVVRRPQFELPYLEHSVAMHRYALRGRRGQPLRTYSLNAVVAPFGHYRGIERAALLELLSGDGLPTAFDTRVAHLGGRSPTATTPTTGSLDVVVDEGGVGHDAAVDVVVGADGLHSQVRNLLLAPEEVTRVDTGWGGWVAWSPADEDTDLYEEVWGDGFFLGLYPVSGRTGVFLGGPRSATGSGPADLATRVAEHLRAPGPRLSGALKAVGTAADAHHWDFHYARCARWTSGHVALVGDAAAAFLPTAGVGAAMAVESAACLADHLHGVVREGVPAALAAYEYSQRTRVESAQDASRRLARLMFRQGWPVTVVRDLATHLVSLRSALRPILRLLEDRPNQAAIPAAPRRRP